MTGHTVQGKVIRAFDLAPLANQQVRLIAQAAYIRDVPGCALLPAGQLDWTGALTDFKGSRWDCWEQKIKAKLPQMTWADFRDNALIYNPHLADDGRLFNEEKTYLMPDISPPQEVAWTRKLTGFSGSRWDCWEKEIKAKVPQLSWESFRDSALVHNPHLAADGRLFQPAKTYLVPEVVGTARAAISATTDANGNYRFAGVLPGAVGIIEVAAPGYTPLRQPVVINGDIVQPLVVKGGGSGVRSALPSYGALHARVRQIIDQALAMLGDEKSVFDSLPAHLQKMCYGASAENLANPNGQHYKDIVCADLVSIAFAAAGVSLSWPGPGGANPHMANYYAPGAGGVKEITDANDWQPGDVLVFGNNGAPRAGHVVIFVGPFQGTDRSGKTYNLSANYECVEASMNFDLAPGRPWGLGNIACTRRECLQGKRGYQWVRRVRLNEVAGLLGN